MPGLGKLDLLDLRFLVFTHCFLEVLTCFNHGIERRFGIIRNNRVVSVRRLPGPHCRREDFMKVFMNVLFGRYHAHFSFFILFVYSDWIYF